MTGGWLQKKEWLVFKDQTVRVMKRRNEGSDSAKLDNVFLNVKSQECPKSRDGKKKREKATKGSLAYCVKCTYTHTQRKNRKKQNVMVINTIQIDCIS